MPLNRMIICLFIQILSNHQSQHFGISKNRPIDFAQHGLANHVGMQ